VNARERCIEAGLCIYCTKLARPDRVTCVKCGIQESDQKRARYRERNPNVRQAKCARCKAVGHDRRVCARTPTKGPEHGR
jgi:hypothetical protein